MAMSRNECDGGPGGWTTQESLACEEARRLYVRLRARLKIHREEEATSLSFCGDRERLRAARAREIRLGREGSWLYDANRLVALRQAEALLDQVLATST
jgi:hypothetical protein